ncbi:hypothetical protein GcM1_215064 [Golovinomyces cichoracearum]|uniref:Uncharacterized protein n=1 Tax=Golovinomyces cichoracearum TaxID=62708 RepID=A0A420ITY4_9PEZI|nr:hypothetical protein GcM1_215064 [Golovinomyces cichoracearum]
MSSQYNSFLPSGAVNMQPFENPHHLLSSANTPAIANTAHHYKESPSYIFQPYTVMSPPKTRSGSVEDSNSLTEDWCKFVQQLRNQFQGERIHFRADRDRMQEIIEGERILWEHERQLWNKERIALQDRIMDLETKLISALDSTMNLSKAFSLNFQVPISGSKHLDGLGSNKITQESGRNADGTPFYAPAPQSPTRTFDFETASDLRVDDLSAPQQTAIRVTSKELTSSDFVQRMGCSLNTDLDQEVVQEAIDISHIQPELDGVAIRVSAVSPTFAANVILPQSLPSSNSSPTEAKLGPNNKTHMKTETSCSETHGPALFTQPENKRLTLFAGHTPNHSVSKFNFPESESVTPAQELSSYAAVKTHTESGIHDIKYQELDGHFSDESDEFDEKLSEPLGLVNISGPDEAFLTQLTEKLTEEARKSENLNSPSSSEQAQFDLSESPLLSSQAEKEEGPLLKMKPSMNFGRPFGSF